MDADAAAVCARVGGIKMPARARQPVGVAAAKPHDLFAGHDEKSAVPLLLPRGSLLERAGEERAFADRPAGEELW